MMPQTDAPSGVAPIPFGPPASPGQAYPGVNAQAVLAQVLGSLLAGRQAAVIHGAPGIGKTVLLDAVADALHRSGVAVVRMAAPHPEPLAVQRRVGAAIGLGPADAADPGALAHAIAARLPAQRLVLLLDDAHAVPDPALRHLWLLSCLAGRRLQLLLVGWPVLSGRLRDPALAPLRRASGVPWLLLPLEPGEARRYLEHRLRVLGPGGGRVLPRPAADDLLEQACGVPGAIDRLAAHEVARRLAAGRRRAGRPGRAGSGARQSPDARWIGAGVAAAGLAVAGVAALAFLAGPHDRLPQERRLASTMPGPAPATSPGPGAVPAGAGPVPAAPANPYAAQAAPGPAVTAGGNTAGETTGDGATGRSVAGETGDGSDAGGNNGPGIDSVAALPKPPPPPRGLAQAPGLMLVAVAGDTMPALYGKIYRGLTPPPYDEVAAINPVSLRPGDVVVFPTPPNGWHR